MAVQMLTHGESSLSSGCVWSIGKILYVKIDFGDFLESLFTCVCILLYTQYLSQFDNLVVWKRGRMHLTNFIGMKGGGTSSTDFNCIYVLRYWN